MDSSPSASIRVLWRSCSRQNSDGYRVVVRNADRLQFLVRQRAEGLQVDFSFGKMEVLQSNSLIHSRSGDEVGCLPWRVAPRPQKLKRSGRANHCQAEGSNRIGANGEPEVGGADRFGVHSGSPRLGHGGASPRDPRREESADWRAARSSAPRPNRTPERPERGGEGPVLRPFN